MYRCQRKKEIIGGLRVKKGRRQEREADSDVARCK